MSNDRSREALGRFLDFLGEKGMMAPATAQTRKASALKLLSILDAQEAADVTTVDVDDLVRRFHNLHGQKYNPTSVRTYRSRLQSALTDFQSYLKDPLSFKPSAQARERAPRARRDNGNLGDVARAEMPTEPARPAPPPVMAGMNVMPIPIRADLTILIHGLPQLLRKGRDRLFLRRTHGVEAFVRYGDEQTVNEVAGEHDLFGHFVELGRAHRRQGIVLAVDGAGLQAKIDLAKSERCGGGAQRLAKEQPLL